jgi:hypothetical protein
MAATASLAGEQEPPATRFAPFLAASRKSPKTTGGVILLEGRGPFHPLICTDCLGSLNPGGELEIARPSHAGSTHEGEAERALGSVTANGETRRSHGLAAAPGNPILP